MMMLNNDKDRRYFVEIDLGTLQVIRVGSDHKENLHKGHQQDAGIHRLFLSAGQYHKFVERCHQEIEGVLDS